MKSSLQHKAFHSTFLAYVILNIFCFFSGSVTMSAYGQQNSRTVQGTVLDEATREPLMGVNVVIKGTSIGTITNLEGNYSMEVPGGQAVLQFSFIGMITEEREVGALSTIHVELKADREQIDEVVITALGISRKKKTLGYSTQKVTAEALETNQTNNVMSGLAGKVAGMQINTSNTIGGSTRITLRGESSLTKDGNAPLIVVDGVPIANEDGSMGGGVDFGSGLNDISPSDIESLNVLKGPAAAALYGSRAGNGAIVITTKSAAGADRARVSFNASVTVDDMLRYPTGFQYKYGPGVLDSYYHLYNKDDLTFNLEAFDETWSSVPYDPDFLVEMWYSPTSEGYRAGDTWKEDRGEIEKVPYVSNGKNNYEQFYKKGITQNYSVAVALPGKNINSRVSFSHLGQTGIMPGTNLNRNNVSVNTGGNLSEKLSLKVSATLSNSGSDNLPRTSDNNYSIPYVIAWTPPGTDFSQLTEYWQRGTEGEQFVWRTQHNNPYFICHEIQNSFEKNRVFGNVSLNYAILENLRVNVRYAMDMEGGFSESIKPVGMMRWSPSYSINHGNRQESNADILVSYNKQIFPQWHMQIDAGGNLMRSGATETSAGTTLILPGYSNLSSGSNKWNSQSGAEKQINSLYASANIGFSEALFINLTARNDWSSTLPLENNSYFYPSVGLSVLIHEFISMPEAISFLKIRGAVAQVGKDTDPYRLESTMAGGGENGSYRVPGTIPNSGLKPEITTSYEGGLNTYLFGIAKFDFTYYYISTVNQVVDITIPISSGYDRKRLNAGEIENQGIEAVLGLKPVEAKNLSWELEFNYSRNRNKLISVGEGLDRYPISSFGRNTSIIAGVGQPCFGIYGYKHATVEDENSPHYGRKLYTGGGAPVPTTEPEYLGNANPDWQLGIGNRLKYKGLSLEFSFDMRFGGKIYSGISQTMYSGGHTEETVKIRDEGIVGDGVVLQSDGTYRENTQALLGVDIFTTWKTPYTNISENFLYDGTYIKLRDLSLSYTLPAGMLSFLKISSARVSLIGRNLWLSSKVPNQDPDVYSEGVPGNAGKYYFPTTRSYGVNLSLQF